MAQQLESDAIRHSNRLARSRAGALSAAMQVAGLYEVVTPRPDLEFLYVDPFLRTHDTPPDRCTR